LETFSVAAAAARAIDGSRGSRYYTSRGPEIQTLALRR
jgi:hypothetical protein